MNRIIISDSDFSANKVDNYDEVDNYDALLVLLKAAIEAKYYEHYRYTFNKATSDPSMASTNRNAVGIIDVSAFYYASFKVIPKSGCKIVPIQNDRTTALFDFSWTTDAVTFEDLENYPYVGFNVAYSDDSTIADDVSIWTFIDVEMVKS